MEGGAHDLKRMVRSTLIAFAALLAAVPASAHDFTDRRVKDLENAVEVWIGPDQVYIDYWFLFGELEALGFRQGMDTDGDQKISPAERKAWLDERKKRIDDVGFLVDLDDKEATPTLLSEPVLDMTLDDVVGPVPFTLSFELSIPIKDLPPGDHTLRFAALNIQERPAAQRLVVTVDQCEVLGGIPEEAERFAAGTPPYEGAPDTVSKVFTVKRPLKGAQLGPQIYVRFRKPAEFKAPTDPRVGRGGKVEKDKGQESALKALVEDITLPGVIVALALAFFWGMGHGFAPGHGKTIVAAYLVGERGTVLHAVILGVVVTITHLSSVVLMCLILTWALARAEGTAYRDSVEFWSEAASGGITFLVGAGLFASRLRGARAARATHGNHGHEHGEHEHEHEHGHEHGEHGHGEHEHEHEHGHEHDGHSHVPVGEGPPSLWGIVWLGISGGIVPCPTAWVLLLLSMQVHRFSWGLILIAAFSLGLALVLVALGVVFVKAKSLLDRSGGGARFFRALAVASPVLIMVLGVYLTWDAIAGRAAL